jgi:hypothetical protein
MTSFAHDVRPLFRDKDVEAMTFMLDLSDYDDVKENADDILATVEQGTMPCDLAWTTEQVAVLRQWMSEDFPE